MIKFERKPRARKWKFDPFPKDIKAIGIFTGADVEIFNEQDCKSLFENGAFGLNPKPRQILMFNQQQNMKIISDNEYMRKLEFKNKFGTEEDDELIQLENGEVHPDPFKIPNSLVLSLEEAFFLHKILNCLEIRDIEDKILSTSGIWTKFCRLKENFVECFIAYLFLKSKNWVIKSGLKFGGDFLLYKQSPSIYHASFVVIIQRSDERKKSTNEVNSNIRIAETTGKQLLYLEVVFPSGVSPENYFDYLEMFQVNEVSVKRSDLN